MMNTGKKEGKNEQNKTTFCFFFFDNPNYKYMMIIYTQTK
jgi:hypothetical protein